MPFRRHDLISGKKINRKKIKGKMFDDINEVIKKKQLEERGVVSVEDKALNRLMKTSGFEMFYKIANELEVSDYVKAKQAVNMVIQLKTIQKDIEKTRKKMTEPYVSLQKALKKKADEMLDQLRQIEIDIRNKLEGYYASVKQSHLNATSLLKLGDMKIDADEGKAYQKEIWDFKTTDLSKVPLEYLQINEDAVKKAIKKGIREIEGLSIYCETITKFRAKREVKSGEETTEI